MAGRSPERPGQALTPTAASPAPRRRGWLEVRWRQFRHAPRPVVRAVASSLVVAVVLGAVVLAYDIALDRGLALPGGDLLVLLGVLYVAGVLIAGTVVTWLIVPLPSGSGGRRTRTPWSAALGFFAAVPIAYLVLVVALQIVRPLLG